MKNPKTFGVWGNIEKDAFWKVLPKIINWAKDKNLELFLTEKIISDVRAKEFDQPVINSKDKISEMDILTVDNSHRMLTSIDGALKRVDAE